MASATLTSCVGTVGDASSPGAPNAKSDTGVARVDAASADASIDSTTRDASPAAADTEANLEDAGPPEGIPWPGTDTCRPPRVRLWQLTPSQAARVLDPLAPP
ncbi:MAG: hypothetical protein AAFX99_08435 [Myxococcota bacterium]